MLFILYSIHLYCSDINQYACYTHTYTHTYTQYARPTLILATFIKPAAQPIRAPPGNVRRGIV